MSSLLANRKVTVWAARSFVAHQESSQRLSRIVQRNASSASLPTRRSLMWSGKATYSRDRVWTSSRQQQQHPSTTSHRGFAAAIVPPGQNGEDEESRREVAADLFQQYCQMRQGVPSLDFENIRSLLQGIGVDPQGDEALHHIFDVADVDGNGLIDLEEFLEHSDFIMGGNPARIILVVGGPGSGKGELSKRLQKECHAVHLSSGDMLRQEVARGSVLGKQVKGIMERGELVSSAIMVALMKRRMRDHPGKRVLLDGFPRSAENARDLITLCGKPELALHLVCDDTVLLERIIGRGEGGPAAERRADDNFETALERLRTFHKHHPQTLEWLREHHVPVINLDCSGSAESVWQQLQAIGRLMRPAVKLPIQPKQQQQDETAMQQSQTKTNVPQVPIFAPIWESGWSSSTTASERTA
eukprot:CAMPEP_0172446476 /NCGR_PEP_ID=MMETSP1065-20121228/6065_1 /TAXON_ID=265537 /ORGANISM="Amphiprora paludosa, Strain CCMP125" /LENGTH=414 /DNA_ID=CAMNT_0013197605 /DNA_START=28 /DNA_END=1272 /DNA_ORIENTATION=+